MKHFRRGNFEVEGFSGFVRVSDLRDGAVKRIPNEPGVYVVLREHAHPPEFLTSSLGGHFKGKNPTVAVAILRERWIDDESLLYVGQSKNLKDRVNGLIRFGSGRPVGHWGGRYLWQLSDCEEMLVAWAITETQEGAKSMERAILSAFYERFGHLPYANIDFPR
jgi:hypothetical protein